MACRRVEAGGVFGKKYRTAGHLILEYETDVQNGRQTFNASADALKTIAGALADNLKECAGEISRQVAGGGKKFWIRRPMTFSIILKGSLMSIF